MSVVLHEALLPEPEEFLSGCPLAEGWHGRVVYTGSSGVSAGKPLTRHCRPLSPAPFRAKQITTLSS